jgi:predicted GTPase
LLCGGRREHFVMNKALTIAQRSRMLDFGIIEQFMMRNEDKRVLVISVMGAQSTGKSYLMNRLFGTRFTVASSRTTDGLWISLI